MSGLFGIRVLKVSLSVLIVARAAVHITQSPGGCVISYDTPAFDGSRHHRQLLRVWWCAARFDG